MSGERKDKATIKRSLLFGVVATHLHMLKPEDLARAGQEWSCSPEVPLGRVLVDMGLLRQAERDMIEEHLDQRMGECGGDPAATLASFGGEPAITESFVGSLVFSADSIDSLLKIDDFHESQIVDWPGFGGGSQGGGPGSGQVGGWGSSDQGHADAIDTGGGISCRLEDQSNITRETPGRYFIKGEIARGGIGRILRAYDTHIGREVALKVTLADSENDFCADPEKSPAHKSPKRTPTPRDTSRFLREARIAGRLNHPYIVPVHEIARRADGTVYYTMRLVSGKTLSEHFKAGKTIAERLQLLPNFLDLCQAMAYAHSLGIIHRDLKPANVVLGEWGETVVLDWGLAKATAKQDGEQTDADLGAPSGNPLETMPGSPLGTPAYMSPEQAAGELENVDERSDVWSLGAILYRMLTGQPPFKGDNAYDVMGKVMKDDVVPPARMEPEAPAELCAIAERCLQKERGLRYRSAVELAEDVSQIALEVFGPMSFVQIRKERNIAVEQKRIAEEQRALAEKRESEARRNLAEAYFQYGQLAEREDRWNDARVYYAKSLSLTDREDARSALYREATREVRVKLHRTLFGHQERVTSICFSPDGKTMISGSWDESIKLWDVETGECLRTFLGNDDWVTSVAFSPRGDYIISGSSDTVNVWSAETGECVIKLEGHESEVMCVAVSPDGRYAASGSVDQTVRLWEIETGDCLAALKGHRDWVTAVDFSPDQNSIASGSWDKTVRVWDIESGECVRTLAGHEEEVTSVAFDMECIHILSAGHDRTMKLWKVETGECVRTYRGHEDRIYSAAFHALGNLAISGSDDKSIRLWSVDSGDPIRAFVGHEVRVCSAGFSPDGNYAASGSWDKTVKIWSIARADSVKTLWGHENDVTSVAVSGDGRMIVSGSEDMTVTIWSALSGACLKVMQGHEAPVSSVAFSPDNSLAVSGSWDNNIRLWSVEHGVCLRVFSGHQDDILSLAFTADGERIVSASHDTTIRMWSIETGECLRVYKGHEYPIYSGAVSPGGDLLLSGSCSDMEGFDCVKGEMILWDLETGEEIKRLAGHGDNVLCVDFSPDGKLAASGSLDTVIIWDLEKGEPLRSLEGHRYWVKSLGFSPDGKHLVTGGDDGSIKLWSALTGKCLLTLGENEEPVYSVCFSPDGKRVVSGGKDQAVKIWPVLTDIMTSDNYDLLDRALEDTGLYLDGFKLLQTSSAREPAEWDEDFQ